MRRLGNLRGASRRLLGSAAAAAFLLVGGCAQIYYATIGSADTTHNLAVQHGIVFDREHDLALDVYAPHNAAVPGSSATTPIVVFFYGGSWEHGRRGWYRYVGEALASNGVIAVIPDYRKYPEVRFPAFMTDAAHATKWAIDHAANLGGDPHRIFVMGHSAGGHIAALLACEPHYLAEVGGTRRDLAGMIGLAGAYAFLPYVDDEADIFGDDADGRHNSQPINFVDGNEPPMLLVQGTDDDEVEPRNAQAMAERARAMGGEVTLRLYPRADHADVLIALARGPDTGVPSLRDVLRFIADPQGSRSTRH